MREFLPDGASPTLIVYHGSTKHIQWLAAELGWSFERICEYFRTDLTPTQIKEILNEKQV